MTKLYLRMLVDKIIIKESARGLDISIDIKAQFRMHIDEYEKSEICNQALGILVTP